MLPIPAALHTSEVGSFAHSTLCVRVPEILRGVRCGLEPLPPGIAERFEALHLEITSGAVTEFADAGADTELFAEATRPHLGKNWLDLPWFFAEALFYRRVLHATGFFGEGPLARVDPYAQAKHAELTPSEGLGRLSKVLEALADESQARVQQLLLASLWGNRVDLSYNVATALGAYQGDAASDLLIDDTGIVVERLTARAGKIALIADNTGTELLMDLALVRELLSLGKHVELHLKAQPTFVSDATREDFVGTLACLERTPGVLKALAQALNAALDAGQLEVVTDLFYTSPWHYPQLPEDLVRRFRGCDLVILKGDANYRRLCSDAHWPHTTPFSDVVDYFPAPLVALRTLKSELIVGLSPGTSERLSAEEPGWLVKGRRGVIQAWLP